MSQLMVDFIISLDGYASAEGWPGWWGLEGPEYLAWLEEPPERNRTSQCGERQRNAVTHVVECHGDVPRVGRVASPVDGWLAAFPAPVVQRCGRCFASQRTQPAAVDA